MRNFFFLQTFIQDLKYAVRSLRKNPGFVSVVVASLALGIGANSTIFSVMNTLLYRPLPYRGADRTVATWETPLGHPHQWQPPPIDEALAWQNQSRVFAATAFATGTDSSTPPGNAASD